MIALELAKRKAPPTPCSTRMMLIHQAAAVPCIQVTASRIENSVKIAKPRLYIRTRPNMSPTRPRLTTSTEVTSKNPIRIQRKYEVFSGASGSISIPRKMSGRAMRRIELLIVTIRMPMVAFDSAIHL